MFKQIKETCLCYF